MQHTVEDCHGGCSRNFKLRVHLCIVSILLIGDAKAVDQSSYRSNVHCVQKWSKDQSLGYAVRNANSRWWRWADVNCSWTSCQVRHDPVSAGISDAELFLEPLDKDYMIKDINNGGNVKTDEGSNVTDVGCFNNVVENLAQRRLSRVTLAVSWLQNVPVRWRTDMWFQSNDSQPFHIRWQVVLVSFSFIRLLRMAVQRTG